MLTGFVRELEALLRRYTVPGENGDHETFGRDMHTLKGLSASVGLAALSRCAADAELALADGARLSQPGPDPQPVLRAVRAALPTLRSLLDTLRTEAPAQAPPPAAPSWPGDTQPLRAELQALLALLEASDMAATDRVADVLGRAGGALGPRARLLDEAVCALDFEVAAAMCREWMAEGLP
jgi:HPt (histidine-containing phosphotransfer) domain-containing protein